MTGDMIALRTGGDTVFPFAGEAEIIGALSTNVIVAEMIVEGFGVGERFRTVQPLTVVKR